MIAHLVAQLDGMSVDLVAHLARRSEGLDRLIMHLHGLDVFKGGVLLTLLAWIWFSAGPDRSSQRIAVLKTIMAGLLAAVVSRGLQNFLPPRPRPMTAAPDFVAPFGLTPEAIEKMSSWSSFPSDHAALFFALAAGIWLIDRRFGAFALLWTAIVICLPRVYLGLHYASDIIGGGVLGLAATLIMHRVPDRAVEPACRLEKRLPGPFYAVAFIFSFELAGLFWDLRSTAAQVVASAGLLAGEWGL